MDKERRDLQKAIKIIEKDLIMEELTLLEKWELSIFHKPIWDKFIKRKEEYQKKFKALKEKKITPKEFQREYGMYGRNHFYPVEETLFYFITRYVGPEVYDNPSEENLKLLRWARYKALHWE